MSKQNIPTSKSAQQGVSIVEALVAILIFSIGVLGIVGMQANMIQNTSEAKNRVDASYIIQQHLGDMWADSTKIPAAGSNNTNIVIKDKLPDGNLNIARGSSVSGTDNLLTFTVTWQEPGKDPHRLVTTAVIAGY
jgi:type IV pilus assembly protein PilV